MDIESYAPCTGRVIKEDDILLNEADILYNIYNVIDQTLRVKMPDIIVSGNITTQNLIATGDGTAGAYVGFTGLNGVGDVTFQVIGTYTGILN